MPSIFSPGIDPTGLGKFPGHSAQSPTLTIAGVTRDSSGAALGSCTVHLIRTVDDAEIDVTTSDASGNYIFTSVSHGYAYYVVAYKAGSPDVAGTTANTLVGI